MNPELLLSWHMLGQLIKSTTHEKLLPNVGLAIFSSDKMRGTVSHVFTIDLSGLDLREHLQEE